MYNEDLTQLSRLKGDEGAFAAMDAARLAAALFGATVSRLSMLQNLRTQSGDGSDAIRLGAPPNGVCFGDERAAMAALKSSVWLEALSQDAASALYESQVPVGVPDDVTLEELRVLVGRIERLKPDEPMNYDTFLRLRYLLTMHGCKVSTLDVTGVAPATAEQQVPASTEALIRKQAELMTRYPLADPIAKKDDLASDEDEEGDEEEDAVSALSDPSKHNTALRERCEQLHIPYTNYKTALHDLSLYETNMLRLICEYVAQDHTLRVLLLGSNKLGAESTQAEGSVDVTALRQVARMIDANESLRVLDLSRNALRANGFGIIGKALTKNIALAAVDLSGNELNEPARDEMEDPAYEEEDPVFGEVYSGLEAISEVLKKNKFLRVLRLAQNGIHAGDDLTGEVPAEDVVEDFHPDKDAADSFELAAGEWEELPLWRLVSPLIHFHKLEVLDLTGNALQVQGTRMLATALASNHSVRVLDLSDNNIGFRGLHYLAKLVVASPTSVLHTLILRRNQLGGKRTSKRQQKAALRAMEAFADALSQQRRMRRLVFSSNHLGPQLSAALLQTLRDVPTLEELDFDHNEACGDHPSQFDPTVAHHIAAALYGGGAVARADPAHVLPVMANGIAITSEAPTAVHASQPSIPSLTTLRLAGNNILAHGVAILFPPGFALPGRLEEVDLAHNALGDDLAVLGSLLVQSTTLRRLCLAHNRIHTLQSLLSGLASNHALEELDVSHNALGSQEHLTCVSADVRQETIERFLKALSVHPTLFGVNLAYNDLRHEHAQSLLQSLATPGAAPQLRRLDIRQNPKIPQSTILQLIAQVASRPGMELFYASMSAEESKSTEAQNALLNTMCETVLASPSLLDLSGGLRGVGSAKSEESQESQSGRKVAGMRQRLLLNALMRKQEA